MKTDQLIAILLATYNGQQFISQQIDSILNQTNTKWQLFISDDCSSDDTLEIIETYCRQYPNRITNLHNTKRFGNAKDHFFHMIHTVEASYYMLSDQDDVWDEDKIDKTFKRMLQIESSCSELPVLIHTDLKVTNECLIVLSDSYAKYSGIYPRKNSLKVQLIQNCVTGCTALFNANLRGLLLRYTPVDQNTTPILMHDWWLALIAIVFGQVEYIHEPTMMYRQHMNNSVGATDFRNANHIIERSRNHGIRQRIVATMKQAEFFCELYKDRLSPDISHLIESYSKVNSEKKIMRILLYLRTGVLKQGFARRVAQLFMG